MRIGLVLPGLPQYSETFFKYKIKGLKEAGHDVILFTGNGGSQNNGYEHSPAYPVYAGKPLKQFIVFLSVLIFAFLKCPLRVMRLIKEEGKSGKNLNEALKSVYLNAHILNHDLDWLHFGFATMALKRESVAKVIGAKMGVSFRGYDMNIYPLKHPGCYELLWKHVYKVHTISDYLYANAIKTGLNEAVLHEKITPAIDLKRFAVRGSYGKHDGVIRILTIGRLNWVKDYEAAISTIKILKEKGLKVRYDIVGSGKELERLKFAVHQSGLVNEVNFSGVKSHEEINKLMLESEIYLQTSLQEGFCVSVLEAQASGMMCIVSDADGLKENVINDKTGWIVPRRRPDLFAEKITEVLNLGIEERERIVKNARERIEKDFGIEKQNEKFRKFFESGDN